MPSVGDEVLGQVVLRDVDLGRAHQVHVPLVESEGNQQKGTRRTSHRYQDL